MFKTILFPVDSSRESREAVEVVADLVKTYNSRLILLSVVEINQESENKETIMNSPEDVALLLENMKELFQTLGIKADVLEKEGIPSFTICDVADEISANLIVMGCRGLGLTAEGLAESVTHRVINLAPCPVLIVP